MEEIFAKPSDAYVKMCKIVKLEGAVTKPRNQETREMLNVQLRITEPWKVPFAIEGRKLNPTITGIEYASMMGQIGTEPMQRHRARALATFHDEGVAYGSYGNRLRGQLVSVVQELIDDPDSRRAVMTIYHGPADLGHTTKDMPCTLSLQFIVRKGKLNLRVNMRSNDVYLGLPYDLQQFCLLLCTMAQVMHYDIGEYVHSVGSLHLYERDAMKINGFGSASYMDLEHEPLYVMDTADIRSRLATVTMFCQDVALGFKVRATTGFERWLKNALEWENI